MEGIPQPGTIQPQITSINEELKAIRQETIAIQEQQQPLEEEKYQCGQRIDCEYLLCIFQYISVYLQSISVY